MVFFQYRHRLSLHVQAERMVSAAPYVGGAYRSFPDPRVGSSRARRDRGSRASGIVTQRHRRFRYEYNHRSRNSEPRCLTMNRLDFSPNVERLPIFGIGCGGGVAGLARAARFAQGRPGRNVLFITVDLCSLCARPNDPSMAMFVAAALFGDGAAGVVLRASANSGTEGGKGDRPLVLTFGEHTWRNTRHIMGWDVKSDGFGVVLSPELPTLMREILVRS